MTTFTDVVAAVVLHLATAAYSHFGVTLERFQLERPAPAERVVARSPRRVVKVSNSRPAPVRMQRT